MGMANIFHDSHDLYFKNPFGAMSCGQSATLRIAMGTEEEVKNVWVLLHEEGVLGVPDEIAMTRENQKSGLSIFSARINIPYKTGILWYHFKIEALSGVFYYGNNSHQTGGVGQTYILQPKPYQITVYSKELDTPSWFRQTVVYQIFPDRFFNGNDGRKIYGRKIYNKKKNSFIYSQWDDTPVYVKDDNGELLKWDFFGGNLKGIIRKLDYLKKLGVGCIYLNPIFESPSNHRYDVSDYKKVDGMLGDDDVFRKLVTEAQKRGISIVVDGVFSHTGSDSIYFNRYGNYAELGAYQSKDSIYYRWYKFESHPDEYKSWWGIKSLPEVNELDETYTDYIISGDDSVLRHWMSMGIKGWRLDVADELPDEFIERFRESLKKIDEEAVLIGEVWEDASNKISYEKRRNYLLGKGLDSVTNYPFRRIMLDFMFGEKGSRETTQMLMSLYENYPAKAFYSNLNLIGSHDVSRILTLLGGAPESKDMDMTQKYRYKLDVNMRQLGLKRLKLLSLVQMTYPGVPCIYYADEAGMEGYEDPFNRATYPWGGEDQGLLAWYRHFIRLRNENDAFKVGHWSPLELPEDVFGFTRSTPGGRGIFGEKATEQFFVVIINRSPANIADFEIKLAGCKSTAFEEIHTGEELACSAGILKMSLEGYSAKIFKKKDY
ncbi:amylopullulanase Apu [Peptoclostridium acidaminophilum DSM 3953]|uniref:Amylopullulanase Apu n=1 Tax=Peptoclostridium acidaminophilum DSM 3953 TaxID=1286171 RepID=W8TEI2_PEPAC|nr:glycoside hydrolase family 13 protein [Peptoclostridium acidaminophilum]AHM56218.1 amylopullulanase Apu [Peptoclostridium acidaminophilum DSM 3953]